MNCDKCQWNGNIAVCRACQKADSNPAVQAHYLEPPLQHALPRKASVREVHSRCSIAVHSIRTRLADPDGISAKAVIDGLRAAGVLSDDSAEFVKEVRYSQEKGASDETIITVEWE